ncbi:hypothetical protein ACHAQJ_009274 [Trichoderma viride]
MKLLTLSTAVAVGLSSLAQGHPARTSVVHEKRDQIPPEWTKVSRAVPDTTIELRIGLKQSNLEHAEDLANQISHPKSEKYGKFLTAQQVIDLFAAPQEVISETVQWLQQGGISSKLIKPTAGRNWLKFNTTVAVAEKLLDTTYYTYRNEEEGVEVVACEAYSVPEDIQSNIDLIMPTIQFETRGLPVSNKGLERRDTINPKFRILESTPPSDSLANCSQVTTPACLRAQYGLPDTGEAVEGNSYGIVEFAPQSFNQDDLNVFFSTYASNVPNNTGPIIDGIDGGYFATDASVDTRGESNLDLCYGIGLVHPQPVTLYQVGDNDPANPATNNNFLDAIDGAYCTYEGGDDHDWDAIYPHDGSIAGEYLGQPDCGTYNVTKVISISYGSNESDRPISYRSRECSEYMKLALMGVTVLFSSGDTGVSGLVGRCLLPNGAWTPPGAQYGRFNPMWPGTCPWITSVGGSALPANGSVGDKEVASYNFGSGGGFSNVFALPSYQADAVAGYYANHDPGYNSSIYNNTQQVRGFPDLAVASQDFITGLAGGFLTFSGTSAASPTFGAMITLINGERIKNGKGSVGFLNPVLYSHPEVFDDITEGVNYGCGTDGFPAVEGWDPITGLGAPNFAKLRDLLLSLP